LGSARLADHSKLIACASRKQEAQLSLR